MRQHKQTTICPQRAHAPAEHGQEEASKQQRAAVSQLRELLSGICRLGRRQQRRGGEAGEAGDHGALLGRGLALGRRLALHRVQLAEERRADVEGDPAAIA